MGPTVHVNSGKGFAHVNAVAIIMMVPSAPTVVTDEL
jgi:hypothetical protein